MLSPGFVIPAEWIAFVASWLLAASWSSAAERRLGMKKEIFYRVILLVGAVSLAIPSRGRGGPMQLWWATRTEAWWAAAVIALGFAFAWWARVHLGALWSGRITAKKDHRLIDTGPYGIVRHPMYTGILLSIYATALIKGTAIALVGALIVTLGIWMKARLEELWLSSQLEVDAYARYRRLVPMLIPLGPRSS
jgi:protein-S-isoprenylcysteine O-methyltransferase Ste14